MIKLSTRNPKIRIAAALVGTVATVWLGFQAAVRWWPYPANLETATTAGTWLEDRHGQPLAAFVAENDQWHLPLEAGQISPHLLNAIVAVEDHRYFQHHGVDWPAIAAAGWQDLTALKIKRGASTITMQVQRLRDPRPRTFANKLEEAIRACQLEQRHSKNELLVEYVNRAPFGGNLVGAGAASWRYFGRPCRELSLGQAALLAGVPQNPAHYHPDRYPQRAILRRKHVLDRMLASNLITIEQRDQANAEPVDAAWRPLPQTRPAGLSSADGALPTLSWLATQNHGRSLVTTLDATIQRQSFVTASEQLNQLESSGVKAVAVVILDTLTSDCLAAVSLSHVAGEMDLTRSPRSTGSVLKPLIYAAAFEAGICNPETVLRDSPASWSGYSPLNYDHEFRGELTAAEALAESRNIPAMLLLSRVGVAHTRGLMESAGLTTLGRSLRRYGLSLAIGGAEATPMEVATAYATLARGGTYLPSKFLQSANNTGTDAGDSRLVIRSSACWQVMRAISTAERTAGVCAEAVPLNVAWKTGTSSGHRDAWCAAATPRRTVVVWMGNPGGQGSQSLIGQEAAAPLALRLIASLDHGGQSWPAAPDTTNSAVIQTTGLSRLQSQKLTIISPADGQEFFFHSDAPADRQQLLLKAALNGDATTKTEDQKLWWFVDGQSIRTAGPAEQIWWSPSPGAHEIRVVNGDGRAAAAHIRIR